MLKISEAAARMRSSRCIAVPLFTTRVIACLILGFFCFQLIRVFLVVPTDSYLCSSTSHPHDDAVSPDHHHDDAEEVEAAPISKADPHTYIQHCKDTVDGLGLIPLEAFWVSSTPEIQTPQAMPVKLVPEAEQASDNFLPPPFQPPRYV